MKKKNTLRSQSTKGTEKLKLRNFKNITNIPLLILLIYTRQSHFSPHLTKRLNPLKYCIEYPHPQLTTHTVLDLSDYAQIQIQAGGSFNSPIYIYSYLFNLTKAIMDSMQSFISFPVTFRVHSVLSL